jgi:hypothetical protein
MMGYPEIPSDKRESLRASFVEKICPILEDIPIYPDEALRVIGAIDRLLSGTASADDNFEDKTKIVSDIYLQLLSILGADRAGVLCYRTSLLFVDGKRETARKRYESYGYQFYLDDLNYYTELCADVRELGEEKFSGAVSMLLFLLSGAAGAIEPVEGGGVLKVGYAELCMILEKQGEVFLSRDIGDAGWEIVLAILTEFIPERTQGLRDAMLYTLGEEGAITASAPMISPIIALYSSIVGSVGEQDVALIASGGADAASAVAQLLLSDRAALSRALFAIAQNMPPLTERQVKAVNAYDSAGYAEFLARVVPKTEDEVIMALDALCIDGGEEAQVELSATVVGYIAAYNSAIAYVYFD